ncbi:hypothetical protein N7507_008283 [Penicillium longicatenatum]|nr:hypothetical protein N7507_008283 [Penicillium longicatenatum]
MQLVTLLPFLTVLGSGLASPMKRNTVFEIQGLCATLYSNDTLGNLQFTVQNPSTNLEDSCYISWNPSNDIQPGIELNKCAHDNFEFGFHYGLQIEIFVLDLKQVKASQTAYQVINSSARNSNWVCVKNPEEGIKERCHYNGVLDVSP